MARIHYQGVQQSLLHQTTTPPTDGTERTEPSCRERTPTDGTDEHRLLWCAVLPQNSQNTQNLAAWVWQGCHTLLICEHPCSSVGGSSLPEGSVCAFCGNIFSPTDFSLGGYGILPYPRHLLWDIIPQNTPNSQNLLQRRASHRFHRFTQILGVRCSPTEFTEYTEFGSVGMQQGCHTLLICKHPCSSVGGSSLPEGSVCSVRSVGISFLPRMARIDTDS